MVYEEQFDRSAALDEMVAISEDLGLLIVSLSFIDRWVSGAEPHRPLIV
jgi:hypothetical protein